MVIENITKSTKIIGGNEQKHQQLFTEANKSGGCTKPKPHSINTLNQPFKIEINYPSEMISKIFNIKNPNNLKLYLYLFLI